MMSDPKNLTILSLSLSAIILAAVVAGTYFDPEPAQAVSTSVSGGDYVAATGSWSVSYDLVYVIDVAKQRLIVYGLDDKTGQLEPRDYVSLSSAFSK